jgi:3D (Asp-Asp-Asp) domain-containing protein
VKEYALTVASTAYCLTGTMADSSYTREASVASNMHPLGTKLTLERPGPGGRRLWIVRDRIGYGSQLDFWQPSCATALSWGRRTVSYRLGWPVKRERWRKIRQRVFRWGGW